MLRAVLAFCLLVSVAAQTPPRPQRDQQIADEIRQRLARSTIGKENFKFSVREGVAYWEGSTTVPQRKGAATRMAKSAGARSVVNHIVVQSATPKPAPVAPAQPWAAAPKTTTQAPPAPPAKPRRVKVQWGPL